MLKDLVTKNRSYRRFYEDVKIERETLEELVELARLSPSAANRQSLRFVLSAGEWNEKIFECLGWAGYLSDWEGPEEGERPSAYIIVLIDQNIVKKADIDVGIACQSILLGAAEKGLGGCMFGNVNVKKLAEALALPEYLEIALVVALGKPKEMVVIDEVQEDGSIKYWRDEEKTHHVPKRRLKDIIYRV